ncbi:MAG: M6 family metalloprotease domain-containing protein [Clostridia bacterium]|nr:M6 family metalloprotease domain-containing protein [Clostridia bacterium]
MKTSVKTFLICVCAAALVLLFAVSAFAAVGTDENGRLVCRSHPGKLITLSDVAETAKERNRGPMRAPSLDPAVTDLPLAVIVIGFNNMPYNASFNWADEVFRSDSSLSSFYSDMSFGKFTFTPVRETSCYGGSNTNTADAVNDGVIHVTLDVPHDDWTLSYAFLSRKDIATTKTLTEAVNAAIEASDEYVDYTQYDVNGDGEITTDELAIGFVFAGYEAASSIVYQNGKTKYLWAHAWSLHEIEEYYEFGYDFPRPDGVAVDSYIAISETEDDGSQAPISTFAHELGHYLGLPDLYNTTYTASEEWSAYDVGSLSVMCMDRFEHPETGEYVTVPFDAWSRSVLGWIEPETATGSGVYTLSAQNYDTGSGYTVLRIPTTNPEEYYLLENRAYAGWDVPVGYSYGTEKCGLVLWHIDDDVYDYYNENNAVNNADHRPAVMPLFPEQNALGKYSFIGSNRLIEVGSPFFDKSIWKEKYGELGRSFDLPNYGRGDDADKRSARTNSGIKLEFLDDAGPEMRVSLDMNDHVHRPVLTYVVKPTCTEAGEAAYECPVCGKRYSDGSGTEESDATFIVDAFGHTSPNSLGKCERCGELLVSPDEICNYCHLYHGDGFINRLIAFVHRILYFFSNLFNR